LDADKAKRQELASQKASALSEKVREFDQKEKRLNEELQAKKRGIGAWKKIPGTVINVGRDTVAAGKAMVDAADDVIKEHGTRIRDLDKELSKLPVGNEAELTPPVNPLDSVPAKQKAIMDPDVAKAIQQSHDKQMEAYRDAKAKLALRQRLESDREELAKEARDPESEVGKALRYREKGMQAIQRGTPQPKGK
jgi:hypothetical protein